MYKYILISLVIVLSSCSTYVENKKSEDFQPIHEEISFNSEEKNH